MGDCSGEKIEPGTLAAYDQASAGGGGAVSEWVVALHLLVAFWFVAGIIGRDVTLAKARSTGDVHMVGELAELAGRFERMSVRTGSFAVLILGLLAAWARDLPLAGSGSGWLLVSLILFLSNIPLIPLIFLPRGRVFERELADARVQGSVTPGLSAAMRDRAVQVARTYELLTLAVIIALMVTKPF
jgi:uncharacterized membrane protein